MLTPNIFVTIDSPQNGAVFGSTPIVVTGRVSAGIAQSPQNGVMINGTLYPISNNAYSVSLPLSEGLNTITAGVWDGHIVTATASISVTLVTKGTVTGTVTSASTTQAISSASVSIRDSANILQTYLTDTNGHYTIPNIAPGNFTGTITRTGYVSYSLSGSVTAGQTVTLNAALVLDYPVISNINVTNIGNDTATINWTTNQPTDSRVDYGPTSTYGGMISDPTLMTTHSLVLSGLSSGGTYHFKVTSQNSLGASTSSTDATFATTSPITLTILSPLEGEVIGRSEVLVKGTISDSAAQELGIVVNGVLGSIYGGQFVANHVPLTDGANTLTVTVTDNLRNAVTTSVNVQSTPASNYITLSSNIQSGVAPLQTTLNIDGTFSFTISNLSMSGPGPSQITPISASQYQVSFTTEGIYFFTASVTDGQGVVYTDTIVITVLNLTQMDTLLKGKWSDMKTALSNMDITGALKNVLEGSKSQYQQVFQLFGSNLPDVVSSLPDLQFIKISGDVAEYYVTQVEGGIEKAHFIYFVRDENGLWKLAAF